MKRLTKKILSDTDFSRVAELLTGGFKSTLIVVAGDFMLDRYISGDVERISPEAPVPVIRFREERLVAGGAGNVAANLVGLGVNVFAAGSVGDDIHGWALLDLPLFKKSIIPHCCHLAQLLLKHVCWVPDVSRCFVLTWKKR